MKPVVSLADLVDAAEAGGKAWNLARLARAGLPVPPTAVIPVAYLRTALDAAGLDPRSASQEVLTAMALPPGWAASWTAAAARLGRRVAVRSSAIGEDSAERSLAGAFLSVLDVAPADVPDAVKRVWASWFAARAAARTADGPPAMGVVLQAMIEPAAAGVLFTINPLTGSWREMLVEAVFGLGDALVGGTVVPHGWIVRRPRRSLGPLQRLWSRVRLEIVQEDLPELEGHSGAALDRSQVLKLCRLGLRAEALFGGPQDVEWALGPNGRFALLQSRPVTATASPRTRTDVVWTRRFIGERFPEPPTVFTWSILEPLFTWFVAWPETQDRFLGGGPMFKLVAGRPYLNTTIFRHLAFKLPGAPPPRFMLELLPPDEQAAWLRRRAVAPDWGVYRSIFQTVQRERRWERFRWNPFTNHLVWEEYRARLERSLPVLGRMPVSPSDALRQGEDQIAMLREYCGIHLCSLLFANLWLQVLESVLSGAAPDAAGRWVQRLSVCPDGNLTLAANRAVWSLAGVGAPGDLGALAEGRPTSPAFRAALDDFLLTYGHRAESSWEILAPRWRDRPDLLAPLLAAQRDLPDPSTRAAEASRAAADAQAEIHARLSASQLVLVEPLIALTRAYLLLRENQRFWFERLLATIQGTAQWLGGWLVEQGALATPAEVAWLGWPEVGGLVGGSLAPADVAGWVERRRAQRAIDLQVEPPTFITGDTPGPESAAVGRLVGLGISPGRVRGRVRVVRHTGEAGRLAPGEILVARALDPGSTSLLLTAGGAILELGSLLSHGAIVAREYGRPAVVNLEGVTRRLRDGQEVTVDGTRGMVWVHP